MSVARLPTAHVAVAQTASSSINCTIKPPNVDPSAALARTGPLGDPETEDSLVTSLVGSLVKNAAGAFAGTAGKDAAGWLFNLVLGGAGHESPTPTDAQISSQVAALSTQLAALQTSIANLTATLEETEHEVFTGLVKDDYIVYENAVGTTNTAVANVQTAVERVCGMYQSAIDKQNKVPGVVFPGADDLPYIRNLVGGGSTSGLSLLNALNAQVAGTSGGPGIIQAFSRVVWDSQTAEAAAGGPSGTLYTTEYVNAMHGLVDYYVGLAVQLLNAYTEAYHWSPDQGFDTSDMSVFYSQFVTDVQQWTFLATRNVPILPDHLAVDVQTTNASGPVKGTTGGTTNTAGVYDTWATSPVKLTGSTQTAYCGDAVGVTCAAYAWDASGRVQAGQVVPDLAPLRSYLVTPQLGLTGWRVPTLADWTALVTHRDIAFYNARIDPRCGRPSIRRGVCRCGPPPRTCPSCRRRQSPQQSVRWRSSRRSSSTTPVTRCSRSTTRRRPRPSPRTRTPSPAPVSAVRWPSCRTSPHPRLPSRRPGPPRPLGLPWRDKPAR